MMMMMTMKMTDRRILKPTTGLEIEGGELKFGRSKARDQIREEE